MTLPMIGTAPDRLRRGRCSEARKRMSPPEGEHDHDGDRAVDHPIRSVRTIEGLPA
jgi:hypothetical protein